MDYDSAGIEASEKMADMLTERNISCSKLRSTYKDWNEDLKAQQNQAAIPAEDHPQHLLKNELCNDILMLVKEIEALDINYSEGEKSFLKAQKQNELQSEAMKMASAVFLCLALKEYRQLGKKVTDEEIVFNMSNEFRSYQNRGRWDSTLSDVKIKLSSVEKQSGIVSESEKARIAACYEGMALELLKSMIKQELAEQKQMQTPSLKMS